MEKENPMTNCIESSVEICHPEKSSELNNRVSKYCTLSKTNAAAVLTTVNGSAASTKCLTIMLKELMHYA